MIVLFCMWLAAIGKTTCLTLSGYLDTELNCSLSCGYLNASAVGFWGVIAFFPPSDSCLFLLLFFCLFFNLFWKSG